MLLRSKSGKEQLLRLGQESAKEAGRGRGSKMGRRGGAIGSEKVYSRSRVFMKYHSLAVCLLYI